MVNRGIWYVAGIALIALAGCAPHPPTGGVARSTESDVRPSALPTDLVGTWKGSFVPVAADSGGGNAVGDVTLVINGDGTYTVIEQRKSSMRKYSGVIVANGRMVTLKDSSGVGLSLRRRGDTLYGVARDRTGYALQVYFEKDSGAPSSSPGAQTNPR